MNEDARKPDQEVLTPAQRLGEAVIIAVQLLLFGFFALHQSSRTGFFTARFGTLEMVCLYGPILFSLIPPAIRALSGRRNPARPFEAAANLSLAAGTGWLLHRFPLDFTHLADVLPAAIRFLLAWVTDDLGRIPMYLQVIFMPISVVVNIWRYFLVRRREAG